MDFDPAELDALSREDLILRARARGVERPEQMTRVELRDEIVRMSEPDLERQRRTRGWLGVARDLLASVVESGLNLPDAAAAIRGDAKSEIDFQGPPPVATVTLAEIYAAQGHYEQALRMLEVVIEREPEHSAARALHQRLTDERDLGPGRRKRVVPTTTATPGPPSVAAQPVPVPERASASVADAEPEAEPVAEGVAEPVAEGVAEPVAEGIAGSAAEGVAGPVAAAAPAVAAILPDAQLVVLHASDRAFVYWRLPSVSENLRLRSVTVQPSISGPRVAEDDFRVPVAAGGFWLARFERGTEVRAALGELSSDGFTPVTVARVLGDEPDASFEPPGVSVDAELEAAARLAAGL